MQLPRFSIVVPSFNQGRFLDRTLRSIFQQRYPHLQVVVMDGGSTDESVQIIESYADRLHYWQSQPDRGQAAAINAGMQHCDGDVVAWLNSDDWYCDGALWTVARAAVAHPNHGLYIGNGFRYDQATRRFTAFCPRHVALNRTALCEGVDYILQPSTFIARMAWHEAGGLDTALRYGLDWDLFIRIAQRHAAVLINELLAVSREHADTKTSLGHVDRINELAAITTRHSGRRVSEGSLYYRIHTLLELADDRSAPGVRGQLQSALARVGDSLAERFDNADGFPGGSDPQDSTYVPIVRRGEPQPEREGTTLPTISVVIASTDEGRLLCDALDSVLDQAYPDVQLIVCDRKSTASNSILERYGDHLSRVSMPDGGLADAINTGLAHAHGEIVSWLNGADMLATNALSEIGAAFAADPALDMVYANALYIDESNRLALVDRGSHRTGLYRDEADPLARSATYWSYLHAVPPATIFFRRRLLERCGTLDQSDPSIFDFELFRRLSRTGKVKKIERTLGLCRVRTAPEDPRRFVALYRRDRPSWPPLLSAAFVETLREFLHRYMRSRYGDRQRDAWFWAVAGLAAAAAVTRIGNPEALHVPLPRRSKSHRPRPSLEEVDAAVSRALPAVPQVDAPTDAVADGSAGRMRILQITRDLPFFPGGHGGNARTFALLRALARRHRFTVVTSAHTAAHREATQLLEPLVERLECDRAERARDRGNPSLVHQAIDRLRRDPAGALRRAARYAMARLSLMPREAALLEIAFANLQTPLQHALANGPYDVLQIECSDNAGWLRRIPFRGPTILVVQDVKTVAWWRRFSSARSVLARLRALAETIRFAWYERRFLRRFDALVAMSAADRAQLQRLTHHPHIAVVPNGVDLDYFSPAATPGDEQRVVFTATLNHPPNHDGILYFVREIWPRVQRDAPDARLDIVGADPPADVRALANDRIRVTGFVADVRPYLAAASVVVCPLRFASGTRLKILEAMAMGKAVVATTIAAEGLDVEAGTDILIADTAEALADRVGELLHDPAKRARVATAARATAARYDWAHSAAALDTVYRDVRQRWNAARRNRPLRVGFNGLFVVPGGTTGGLEPYLRQLVAQLLRLDRDTQYVLLVNRANAPVLADLRGENLQHYVVRNPGPLTVAARTLRAALPARSQQSPAPVPRLADLDLDFVHSFPGYIDAVAEELPNVLTIADLQHEHLPELFDPDELAARRMLYPRSARRARHVITLSELTRQELIAQYALPPDRVTAIPLGVSGRFLQAVDAAARTRVRQRYHLPDDYCVYAANLWPHKNHLRLLDALVRIAPARRPHLVLTGAPTRTSLSISDAVAARDLGGAVSWLGFIDDADLPALFAGARLMIFPSLFEGFGMPIVEAMASGCPVACSNAAALPTTGGDAALYFDPQDVEAISTALEQLWNDAALRERLRSAGRAHARRFTWQHTALQTLRIYRDVAAAVRSSTSR